MRVPPDDNLILGAQTFIPEPVEQAPAAPIGEQLVSAFELENTAIADVAREDYSLYEPVEGYDSLSDPNIRQDYRENYIYSRSPQESEAITRQIDREEYNRQITNTTFGAVAKGVANLLDPTTLPFFFMKPFLAGASVAKGLSYTGGAAVLSESGSELGLQIMQETRTPEEAAIRLGAAGLVGGVLGGVVAKMDSNAVRTLENKVADDVLADKSPVDEVINKEARSAGAAEVKKTTIEEEQMVGAAGVEKIGLTPAARLSKSASLLARQTFQRIAENPFLTKKNLEGTATRASVETKVKGYDVYISKGFEAIDEAFKNFKGASTRVGATMRGGMNRAQFNAEVAKAMRRGDVHEIPEVAKAAKILRREVFDPIKERAIFAGLLPADVSAKYAKSYLTRMYNFDKIAQQPSKFRDLLRQSFSKDGADPNEVEQAIDEVMGQLNRLGRGMGGGSQASVVPKADMFKERMLAIPDEVLDKDGWLIDDIETILENYVRQQAPEIEMVREFGERDLRALLGEDGDLQRELAKAVEGKSAKETDKLTEDYKAAARDLEALQDRLYGVRGKPIDPDSWFAEVSAATRTLNVVRLLGGMTVSAFPDLARPVAVNGLGSWASTFSTMILNPTMFNLARKQAKEYGVGLDMVLNTRLNKIGDVDDYVRMRSRVGRGIKAVGDTFGIPSLMAPWNATVKQFAGVMTAHRILQAATRANPGKNAMTKLAASGIDPAMAKRIAEQFAKHGENNGINVANAVKWTDQEAAEAFKAAVLKDVDVAIVTPGIADKPLWFDNEAGKIVTQFQSFSMAAQNRILISGLQQRDMATINGALIAIALGGVTYAAKQKMRGEEITDNPQVLLKEAFDYSGLAGWMMNPVNTMDWATKGEVTEFLTGEKQPSSRYQSRGVVGALVGPTIGTITDTAGAIQDIFSGEVDDLTVRRFRRLMPYQNLFWLRNTLNAIEESISEDLK